MAAFEIHQCEAPAIVSIFLVSGATDALLGAVPAGRKTADAWAGVGLVSFIRGRSTWQKVTNLLRASVT
jgi:hypothetical protein